MAEPFDEVMRRSSTSGSTGKTYSKKLLSDEVYSTSIITPEPSPTGSSTTSASTISSTASNGARGPPSNAFSKHTSDRWNSFERDPKRLEHEAMQSTAQAVASAAERAAAIQDASSSQHRSSVATEGSKSSNNLRKSASYRHGRRHQSSRKSTSSTTTSNSSKQSSSPPQEEIVYQTHDRVRAEALKVLEMADDRVSFSGSRRAKTGSYSTPAALAGLDTKSTSSRKNNSSPPHRASFPDPRFSIESNDNEGIGADSDDDLVDIIAMDNRVARKDSIDSEDLTEDTTSHSRTTNATWSSRYNNPANSNLTALTGSLSAKQILDNMDRKEKDRSARTSARNMYRSSPHDSASSPARVVSPSSSNGNAFSSTRIFGSGGFSFTSKFFQKNEHQDLAANRNVNLQAHKTVWMDVDITSNNNEGHSLPPPPVSMKNRGPKSSLDHARKRRRVCLIICGAIIIIGLASIILGAKHKDLKGNNRSNNQLVGEVQDENAIRFYVTANTPFSLSEEAKVSRDLQSLPVDTDFFVHLGNIQDSSVTLCPQSTYVGAHALLAKSPVPVFVLPGPHDWINCPNTVIARADWHTNLHRFDENFPQPAALEGVVNRQLGNEENFSILEKGVLFLGVKVLGGKILNAEDFRLRQEKNVRWVEGELSKTPRDRFRAIVLMGNANPNVPQQQDFFGEILDDIETLGKPTLYLHANDNINIEHDEIVEYIPFSKTPNLRAVKVRNGGSNPPVRVAIGGGRNPFAFS